MQVLDLFSAACGGWSLGMHRAGFRTMAACEAVEWRRILYAQNNPGVPIYDDVRTLTAERLLADLGRLPDVIVGSPPCQDISSANTKGKGVEGERSGLYFEAIRLIGECRPCWFALENSANLRTRGADAVLAALEALDYSCWPFVVRASDVGANHERPRSWLIGCDVGQVAHAHRHGEHAQSVHGEMAIVSGMGGDCGGRDALNPTRLGHEGGWPRRHGADGVGAAPASRCDAADAPQIGRASRAGDIEGGSGQYDRGVVSHGAGDGCARNTPHPDQAGQADGCMVSGLRQAEITHDGRGGGRGHDEPCAGQMAVRAPDRGGLATGEPLWSLADLAGRLRLDARIPARVAGTRVAVGGPRGTSAASLIVEAYGDAVVPQIPECIGRAILRVEAGLRAVLAQAGSAAA